MQIQFVGFENQDVRETILKYLRNRHEYQVGSIAICLDWPEKSKLPETDFRVLVLQEPSVVRPWQYKKKLRQEFDLVIPMSPWRASSLGYEDFVFQPYDGCRNKLIEVKVRTKKIVMINSAKFSASARSNYGLRRKTSKLLHKEFSSYELYGDNWKMSKFRELQKRVIAVRYSLRAREKMSLLEAFSGLFYRYPEYKGPIQSKETVLTVSQLSLVIENESDCITEKLFDSICSGCVPVYVGPKFADLFPELEDCIIRVNPKADDILKVLKEVTPELIKTKQIAIQKFLNSTSNYRLANWSTKAQWSKIATIISNHISIWLNGQS